jgi:hypothetical protein
MLIIFHVKFELRLLSPTTTTNLLLRCIVHLTLPAVLVILDDG